MVTDRVLDIVIKAKEDAHALALEAERRAHSTSINALAASHALAVGALSNEIVALKRSVEKLEEKLKYESSRADGLVDRLLVRDARVAAVAPSAIQAAVHKDAEAVKKLQAIFDEVNMAGVDFPSKEQRAFDLAGGTAVEAGHSGGY